MTNAIINNLLLVVHGAMIGAWGLMGVILLLGKRHYAVPVRLRRLTGMLMLLLSGQSMLWMSENICREIPDYVYSRTIDSMVNLCTVPMCVLVLSELIRYRKVSVGVFCAHFLPFVLLTVAEGYCEKHGLSQWPSYVFMVVLSPYVVYYAYRALRRYKEYEEIVNDTYANPEGHSVQWFSLYLWGVLTVLAVYVLLYEFGGTRLSRLIYDFWCVVMWSILGYYIEIMRSSPSVPMKYGESDEAEPQDEVVNEDVSTLQDDFMKQLDEVCRGQKLYAMDDLTRNDVARALKINVNRLTVRLREATGQTFAQYVQQVRLEESCRLLLTTDKSIVQVATECGFGSRSTFYRIFTEKMECTPAEYRGKGVEN